MSILIALHPMPFSWLLACIALGLMGAAAFKISDDTKHLLSSPKNAERLKRSIEQMNKQLREPPEKPGGGEL